MIDDARLYGIPVSLRSRRELQTDLDPRLSMLDAAPPLSDRHEQSGGGGAAS